jgi:hypothetical protein
MTTFTEDNATCFVYTFKEGVLSRVAHDLKLQVKQFEIRWQEGEVMATFDPQSIVMCEAMKNGRESPGVLSGPDKRKVIENMHRDVLKTARFPEIRFAASTVSATATGVDVDGYLELVGRKRPVSVQAVRGAATWEIEVWVNQPDFGIKPFKALMGAIKVKPKVKLILTLPIEASA